MKVVLFGATGMVGQGALRECLLDPGVERVLTVGRKKTGQRNGKLLEVTVPDVSDLSSVEKELTGYDTCLFCLGVSSAGMPEEAYRRVTYGLTLAAAGTLARLSPGMTFLYVSGTGTDGTGKGSSMWARVKGETENALLKLPFKAAFMLRPAYIQPLHGITSSTRWTRALYAVMGPAYPLWKTLFPKYVTTTEELGRAMLRVAKEGTAKRILENEDLVALGRAASPRDRA